MSKLQKHDCSASPVFTDDAAVASRHLAGMGISIDSVRQISQGFEAESPCRISKANIIGDCSIGAFSYLGPSAEVRRATIGRFCSIAANVAIGPAEHPLDWVSSHPVGFNGVRYFDGREEWEFFKDSRQRFHGNSARTFIGNDVWIGRNAIVRQGIRVGDGAVIAGNAFVSRDVPPYAIVGGVPARILRYRFPAETIERLLSIRWWDWKLLPEEHDLDMSNVDDFVNRVEQLIGQQRLDRFTPGIVVFKAGKPFCITAQQEGARQ
ncbi:CatB-related O-acetyltransferase [Cupriavidus sp. AU9028]|uniref:CatB-related O-acetyltransferase n=1 Tax=Cupriavidus sp. AU9028 TaxID=2871157 RepID=UPI001C939192|nr:CatB-related O-acetyltransferase [Cupriavidus sp. AU9028]MBY4895859.1 CatB-related O-acetyltransferase [Cupriavidus sp. AU9028]